VLVYPEQLTEIQGRLPLAVMFDNFVDARPQVGIEKADLVFEVVAEGGITRFLGVFWRGEPGRIVPVRSARVYYLDWAAELDAIYVHWGWAKSSGAADSPPRSRDWVAPRTASSSPAVLLPRPDRAGRTTVSLIRTLWKLAAEWG
jgi:hypothetical protein